MLLDWKKVFTDWEEIPKGDWSSQAIVLENVRVGLYREPDENKDYAGSLTLQVYVDDHCVLSKEVWRPEPKLVGFIYKHGKDDFELWQHDLPEDVLTKVEELLGQHEFTGCSVRGSAKEIADELKNI